MKKVNVHEAKARLSALLDDVARGETVIISRRNVPAAELRAIPKARTARRRIGIEKGFVVPATFFDPLPQDVIESFEGR